MRNLTPATISKAFATYARKAPDKRTRTLLEAFAQRVGLPARTRGGDRGVTIHNIRHRLILLKRPRIGARRVLTVRRGPLSEPCARVRFL